ncbi:MAG TPA: LPXTG cell wall anchor domain-containing protein [Streptomyces sp.]|nr:LPXTG cell wall anchor domain-containing protein [Streptomyces sp.]
MRILSSVSVVAAAAASCLLLAPTAYAASPVKKGDNGTVKIHDAKTDQELRKNEPKVCEFYLVGFGFDAGQEVSWEIHQHPPTGRELAKEGTLTLDDEGHGRTEDMTLENGHYKLDWDFEGKKGAPKSKVFWVTCEDGEVSPSPTDPASPPPSEEPGEGPSQEPGEDPSQKPGEEPGEDPSETAPGGSSEDPASPAPSTDPQGDLAETGSQAPVAAMAAAAAALLGAGSYLALRRRKAAQQG